MNTAKQVWDKTKGYKTVSGGILLLLFQLFKMVWPAAMSPEWQDWTYNAIGIIVSTGLLDKAWRNRKDILGLIKQLFTKKIKENGRV